jgi:dTDP-4-amino-4,6-dideoxygalactose transaminase
MIPMVDLREQYHNLKQELDARLLQALEETRFILGPNVQAFEQEAAGYLGVGHAVGCASGTDALHLALLAAGIGAGDEVITTPFTFSAPAEAIRYVGARPVFVDIDPESFNIDAQQIEATISERTRAIMPVHLFGQPADMDTIGDIARRHGLKVIEDCAQSFGASFDERQTGSFGDFGCFSFFPSKNLGCYGDGGLVTTDDIEMAEQLRMFRNHGSHVRYYHEAVGLNSRLDELQAVILRTKLPHIDAYNAGRQRVAHLYDEWLSDAPVITPWAQPGRSHVYHQYTLLSEDRDRIMDHLQAREIASAIYYPVPLHQQKAIAEDCAAQQLPVTEDVARRCLSLPIFPEMTEAQVEEVASAVLEACR